MKLRNTLVLFGLFILLAGYVYFIEIQQGKKKEEAKAAEQKVFHFVKDSVDAIIVENQYGKFVIKQTASGWELSEPIRTEADGSIINTALTNLKDAKRDQVFPVKVEDLPDYGLGANALRVWLILKNGEKDSVLFGEKTPVGSFVFATKVDSVVFTVNDYVKTSFNKKLFDWRDKRLLRFKRDDVKKLVIHNRYGDFEFEKIGATTWRLVNIDRPADSGKLGGILSKLEFNRAKKFVDEEGKELKKYGLAPPAAKVELFLGPEQGRQVLWVSRKVNGTYYAKDEARRPIFEIDSVLVNDLSKKLQDYRSLDFAQFDREKVTRFVLQYGDTTMTCVKDSAGEWYFDEPDRPKLRKYKINTFFNDVNYAKIKKFVADNDIDEKRYGLDKPQLSIDFYAGEELMMRVLFGKNVGDKVYAITNQFPSVYLINRATLKNLKLRRMDILEVVPASSSDSTLSALQKKED